MAGPIRSTPVDPFTEIMLCRDSDAYPCTDFTQLQFRGPIDLDAMAESWEEALKLVPMFSSHLGVERRGVFELPVWQYDDRVRNPLRVDDCRHLASEPFDPMEFSMEYHRDRMQRRMDLEREFPFKGHLLRIFDDRHILSVVYQHSVVDPYKAFKVLTRLLELYHERVKGERPEWAETIGMTALARKREPLWVAPRSTMFTFPRDVFRNFRRWNKSRGPVRFSQIATREILDFRQVKGRYGLRAVIDDAALFESLLARAKRNGATLNDLLLAVALRCITRWNRDNAAPAEYFRLLLASSLKGRTEVPETVGTGLSGLTFAVRGNENGDLDESIGFFRNYRRSILENKLDIKAYAWMSQWYSIMRVLPLKIRMRYLAPMLTSPRVCFSLSNIGVMWPRIEDGRPTLDSAVLGAGDLVIEDMHSCPTLGPNTGFGMIARMHNRRFYMNFMFDRFRFRKDEARSLADRFVEGVTNAA